MTSTSNNFQTEAPFGFLMTLLVALLAPMFLGVTQGDIGLARMAAIETINDYRAENRAGLIAVAQIIAFGLAALGSLSLSMADDITVPMALRLRNNANACHRSADRNHRALQTTAGQRSEPSRPREAASEATAFDDTIFEDPDTQPEPDVFLTPEAEQLLAAESAARLQPFPPAQQTPTRHTPAHDTQHPGSQGAWAAAMVAEANNIDSQIENLPPDQRATASMHAATLRNTADSLLQDQPAPLALGSEQRLP